VNIDHAIAGLIDKMNRLDQLIVARQRASSEGGNGYLVQLFTLYTQGSSRLARLLRTRRALSGEAARSLARAMSAALDELSSEWGVDL
jgi:hypothetical protein